MSTKKLKTMTETPATTVDDCRIINLEHHPHSYGTLTVAQNSNALPFAIKRIYYIYDIPTDSTRGGHSHFTEQCILTAVGGCFDVSVFDGKNKKTFTLKRPFEGLYIPPGIWRTMENFSSGCIVLVLSSIKFDEKDYVRDMDHFTELKQNTFDKHL